MNTEEDRIDFYFNSLLAKVLGWKGVSKHWEEHTEYQFLGFQVDHVVSELLDAKKPLKKEPKSAKNDKFTLFLFLAALKPHGRPRNMKIKFQ